MSNFRVIQKSLIIGLVLSFFIALLFSISWGEYKEYMKDRFFYPQTSIYDSSEYRYLTLPNGLRVVLVSSPDARLAATSMSVSVGSYYDPDDFQGMSHMLEHSLFLGTEKFPEKDLFSKTVQANGGSYNAYTSDEIVNYFFSIRPEKLDIALEQFSQKFISPLLRQEDVSNEREVVQSEYEVSFNDDRRRLYDLIRQLSNERHPFNKLSIGNSETLKDRDDITLGDKMKEFFARYYNVSNFTLAMISNESLDELQNKVETYFSDIKPLESEYESSLYENYTTITSDSFKDDFENTIVDPKVVKYPSFFLDESLPRVVTYERNQGESLDLFFRADSVKFLEDTRPDIYFASILGDESQGSVLAFLKNIGWASSLSAGLTYDDGNSAVFNISIDLTKELGRDNWRTVAAIVLDAMQKVKVTPIEKDRLEEISTTFGLDFYLNENLREISHVIRIANNMHLYSKDKLLSANHSVQLQEDLVKEFGNRIDISSLQIFVGLTGNLSGDIDSSDYYKTPFTQEALNSDILFSWTKSISSQWAEYFNFPQKNNLVPSKLYTSLIDRDESIEQEVDKYIEEKGILIPSTQYVQSVDENTYISNSPGGQSIKKSLIFSLTFPQDAFESSELNLSEQRVYSKILAKIVDNYLREKFYNAFNAGFDLDFLYTRSKFELRLFGYAEKQDVFVEEVINSLREFEITDEAFAIAHDEYLTQLLEQYEGTVVYLLYGSLYRYLLDVYPSSLDQEIELVRKVDISNINTIKEKLFNDSFAPKFLFYGNYSQDEVESIKSLVASLFNLDTDIEEISKPIKYIESDKETYSFKTKHTDSAVIVYTQIEEQGNLKYLAAFEVLSAAMRSSFFRQLRTEQQLGYIVSTSSLSVDRVPGMVLYVESNRASTQEIVSSISEFIENFVFNQEDLGVYKDSVVTQIKQTPRDYYEQSKVYWSELEKYGNLDYTQELINAIMDLTLDDMNEVFMNLKSKQIILTSENIKN